ncbi:MAG: TRAP transporter substrate-binding protein DctP, partial [Spirochaetaceae bacterium]|nr:TRAP transporter substrate-binding protein DctP [Spirochaetaceae bacterium]
FTQEGAQAAVQRGTLDMVYSDAAWVAQQLPYVSMLGAVYTFTGYDHMTNVMNGPIGQEIFDDVVESVGIRPLGAFYLGTRQLNLRDIGREVRTPQDMKGVKLRTPNSPAWIALGKALGGNPTPMSFTEVYMALKTGTADGQDNPLPTDKNAKFYEVTKYIILTDHVVGAIWPSINEEKWQSLTAQQQQWVMEALDEARKVCDETNLAAEAELVEFFRSEGLTVIENPDRDAFAEYARWSYENESPDVSESWDWDLYDRIQAAK